MGAGGNLGIVGIQLAKNVAGATVITAGGLRRPLRDRRSSSAPTT